MLIDIEMVLEHRETSGGGLKYIRRVAVNFWVALLVGRTKSMKMSVSVYGRFDALKNCFCSALIYGLRSAKSEPS